MKYLHNHTAQMLMLAVFVLVGVAFGAIDPATAGSVMLIGATANTKANLITNLDANPPVMNPLYLMGGVVREQVGTAEIAAADDDASVYRLARVHSSWRLSQLTLFNDAITSGTVFDLGLYATAADGGAVVDANAFSDNISLASASVAGTEVLFEGGSTNGVEDIEQQVWQMAGQSSDPNVWYDIALTGDTVGSGAGTVSLRTRYIANN
jgi:hypothetical protein